MYHDIVQQIKGTNVKLIAVSKTKSPEEIMTLYNVGQRSFGENRTQEMLGKYQLLPKDIEWHLIGHLQKNKVKYIAPFVKMIHSVDSLELLEVIQKEAEKNKRKIDVLLQFHIAKEETKFGLNLENAKEILDKVITEPLPNINFCGVMGMASFIDNEEIIREEFKNLKQIFETLKIEYFKKSEHFKEISMGMSGDFKMAIEEGSTMVRIGTLLFGDR